MRTWAVLLQKQPAPEHGMGYGLQNRLDLFSYCFKLQMDCSFVDFMCAAIPSRALRAGLSECPSGAGSPVR